MDECKKYFLIVILLFFIVSPAISIHGYSSDLSSIGAAERYILNTISRMCDLETTDQIAIVSEVRADNFEEDIIVEATLFINGNGPYEAVVVVFMNSDDEPVNFEFLGLNFGCSSFNQE